MKQIDIYDLYLETLDDINIEQRGQLTLDRFNRWAEKACKDFVDYLTGRLHEEPTPKLGLLKTQKLADYLFPIFRKHMMPFRDGLIPYPKDYEGLLSLRISGSTSWTPGDCDEKLRPSTIDQILNGGAGFRAIDVLSHDEIPARVNTHIPLLKAKPCAEQYDRGFALYNAPAAGSAFVAYTRGWEPIKLVMSEDPQTLGLVYNKVQSKHPPFHQIVSPYLARKIAHYHFAWVREEGGIAITDAADKTE